MGNKENVESTTLGFDSMEINKEEAFESTTFGFDLMEMDTTISPAYIFKPKEKPLMIITYLNIVICLLGIIGNSLSILVLLRKRMRKSSINILLAGLQTSDLFVVSLGLMQNFLRTYIGQTLIKTGFVWYLIQVINPTRIQAEICTNGFTVLVTLERYIAVCHPLKVPIWCSIKRAKLGSFYVFLFSTACLIPKLLIDYGILPQTTYYKYSKAVMYFIVFIIPFVVLIGFNLAIALQFRKSTKERETMTSQSKTPNSKNERSLTTMLFSIVITFIICKSVALPLIFLFTSNAAAPTAQNLNNLTKKLYILTGFGSNINSSLNFIFYCFFGTNFRAELQHIQRYMRTTLSVPSCIKLKNYGSSNKSSTSTQQSNSSSKP